MSQKNGWKHEPVNSERPCTGFKEGIGFLKTSREHRSTYKIYETTHSRIRSQNHGPIRLSWPEEDEATQGPAEVRPNHLPSYQKIPLFLLLLTAERVQKFTRTSSAIRQSSTESTANPPEGSLTNGSRQENQFTRRKYNFIYLFW